MSVPILVNASECIEVLREGGVPSPDVQWVPAAVNVDQGHLRALGTRLGDLQRDTRDANQSPVSFDGPAAALLHEILRLDRETAIRAGFWAYLSVVEMPDLVNWRFGKPDTPAPANRYSGRGWKNMFKRLWFRAELAKDPELEDPYKYARMGGEDFWVGLIERQFSETGAFVRFLLPYWFENTDSGSRTMEDHRRFFIALRLLRPFRMYESMDVDTARRLFDHALEMASEDWVTEYA